MFTINFANIYMVCPSRVGVTDFTAIKECFKPFFSSSFKFFWGLLRFVLKIIFTWYFSTNFLMTFLCGLFSKWLSARDRLRWIVCLLLNELSGLEEHWPASSTSTALLFSLFFSLPYRSLTLYCLYFIGFSFNLARHNFLRSASFFFFCSLPLLLYNLHFFALHNPLYSPLLVRPKMIQMMSQTSIQHSLLPYGINFG